MKARTALNVQIWVNIITAVLLILPLILTFVQQIAPNVAVIADAVIALLSGILSVILKIFFTSTE